MTATPPSSPGVIIVNETLARRLAPDGNALGKRSAHGFSGRLSLTLSVVVRDAKYDQLAESPSSSVIVRSASATVAR
jgi:hypothetical protein